MRNLLVIKKIYFLKIMKSESTPKANPRDNSSKNRTRNKINRKMKALNAKVEDKQGNVPCTPTRDNFAWSKTQSSPDPSEVPLPRFLNMKQKESETIDKVELLKNTLSKLIETPVKKL